MKKLGMKENEAIEHPLISRAVENAQHKVEGHNFDIRKHLLEYDDVANDQRKVVYVQRDELMSVMIFRKPSGLLDKTLQIWLLTVLFLRRVWKSSGM